MVFLKRRRWHWLVWVGALLILAVGLAAFLGSVIHVRGFNLGTSYTLGSGEQQTGDWLVVANTITLDTGSALSGDLTLIGEQVTLNAAVSGDVVVISDQLRLGETAHIEGNLTICANGFERAEAAQVGGKIKSACDDKRQVNIAGLFKDGVDGWRASLLVRIGSTVVGALFFGAFAALCTVMFHRPLIRISETIHRAPTVTGGVGCLTILVAAGLTLLYIVSLLLVLPVVLLPLMLLIWLVLALASLIGWIALAEPFGRYVFRLVGVTQQPPLVAAAVGGITLTLLVRIGSVFWVTDWLALLATAALGSVGLGAVVLTRSGTRPFPCPEPLKPTIRNAAD